MTVRQAIEPPAVDAAWRKVREAIDAAQLDPEHRYQITKAIIEYAAIKAITAVGDACGRPPCQTPPGHGCGVQACPKCGGNREPTLIDELAEGRA